MPEKFCADTEKIAGGKIDPAFYPSTISGLFASCLFAQPGTAIAHCSCKLGESQWKKLPYLMKTHLWKRSGYSCAPALLPAAANKKSGNYWKLVCDGNTCWNLPKSIA